MRTGTFLLQECVQAEMASYVSWSTTPKFPVDQIIPFINGINHVAKIAELADADIDLTRLGIQHLL